jgi:hypothetical protein
MALERTQAFSEDLLVLPKGGSGKSLPALTSDFHVSQFSSIKKAVQRTAFP